MQKLVKNQTQVAESDTLDDDHVMGSAVAQCHTCTAQGVIRLTVGPRTRLKGEQEDKDKSHPGERADSAHDGSPQRVAKRQHRAFRRRLRFQPRIPHKRTSDEVLHAGVEDLRMHSACGRSSPLRINSRKDLVQGQAHLAGEQALHHKRERVSREHDGSIADIPLQVP